MRQTLYVIPHFLFEGWLFYGWLVVGALILGYLFSREGFGKDVSGFLPIYAVVAAVIYFVLPQLEVADYAGQPQGIAIRGYGVCVLLGIVFGVYIAHIRCRQVGIDSEQVLTMMFWTVLAGIIGARVFFVIQKFDNYSGLPPAEMIRSILDMTKGGLVVYGSLIGGFIVGSLILWRTKLPPLRVADAVAPGMVLGLAIGRIGCLMNGCCFGGICDPELPNIKFPPGSPPYMQQLMEGDLIGLTTRAEREGDESIRRVVTAVAENSLASEFDIQANDVVSIYVPGSLVVRAVKSEGAEVEPALKTAIIDREREGQPTQEYTFTISQFPERSIGVHPTQIYSSVNAFFLCAVLWFYFPYRRSDGEVFALMLILYSIARFILESIRTDELGAFGTPFTISQCVSMLIFTGGVILFFIARSRGPKWDVTPALSKPT